MNGFALPLALLAAGLASGLHCAGMCGGISAGFSLLQKEQLWRRQLALNFGRVASYAAAGAAVGALGSAGAYMAAVLPAQTILYLFSSAFVVGAGLHLAGFLPLSRLERLGVPLWRRIQPLAARLLPARTLPQAFAAGMAWGWLPCGLVYGAPAPMERPAAAAPRRRNPARWPRRLGPRPRRRANRALSLGGLS